MFIPVPTAVPPIPRTSSSLACCSTCLRDFWRASLYESNSCPRVIGR